jgi:hypothetical protein
MITNEKLLSAKPRVRDEYEGPLSLSGHRLAGDAPVRFIYTDEAGISASEPVTVVAALIVHADTQWHKAANLINALLGYVPKRYQEGFVFHATSIWGNPNLREGRSRRQSRSARPTRTVKGYSSILRSHRPMKAACTPGNS